MAQRPEVDKVSAAFFCPQTKAPDEAYLISLHGFLSHNTHGQVLLSAVAELADPQLWNTFASAREDVRQLSHGPNCLQLLRDWARSGIADPLSKTLSNISSLPLLTVLQAGQYLRYLESRTISHQEFVADIQNAGGVHGYCGGLPSAISIACSEDEVEFVKNIGIALKILVGIGAYTEAADEDKGAERTLLAIRLKYEGQGEKLVGAFPGAYISGITGPRAISIGGPAATIRNLYEFISEQEGLRAEKIDLGGSAHNPKNFDIAGELCRICQDTPGLQLPAAEQLHTPLRSNQTGELLTHGSLTDDLIHTMLSARCEWYNLLINVAQDLKGSDRAEHNFAIFGWADCVTMNPFHQARLKVTKTFAKTLIQEESPKISLPNNEPPPGLPENSVAIIGASCRLPGANDMNELWDLLSSGASRAEKLSAQRFDLPGSFRASQSGSLTKDRTFYGNFIDDVESFEPSFFGINAREAANMDPQQRIMLELSFEALEDAGYLASHERTSFDDVGCFVGLVLAEYMDNTNSHGPTAYTSTGTVPAFLCGRISHTYGWSGPSEMFNTACSSSLVAINRACKAVQTGECRMALAGGVNVITGVNNYLDLAKAGFLSPTGQCKPFDESADGYCRADGAGLVVLKSLRHALEDGDNIWGVIPGIATNQGGLSASITVPSPTAQKKLYRAVLEQAGLRKDHITYVEAHGTGTQVGDPLEMESISSVFGRDPDPRQQRLYVGSLKGNIGHSEPAAGVAGLLKVLMMLRRGFIPPQASFKRLNPKLPSLEGHGIDISRTLVPWASPFHAALVNSYGAAGSNAALVCCEMPQASGVSGTRSDQLPTTSYPLFVSAFSPTSVIENAKKLSAHLESNTGDIDLADLALTLNQRRQRQKYFAFVKVETTNDAARRLRLLTPADIMELQPPSYTRPVVLTFSGQTGKTIGLAKSLYDNFAVLRFHIDSCNTEFHKITNRSLLPELFQQSTVDDTATLQCGLFTVQYAFARAWVDAGLKPAAVLGHSLGELTALVIAGVLSLADGMKLIAARGQLIEKNWGPEKGSMLALECTQEDFSRIAVLARGIMSTTPLPDPVVGEVEVACFNGPKSLVVSGPTQMIISIESIIQKHTEFQRIKYRRLDTSHGFHCALTDPILAELEGVGASLTWNKPCIPIYACHETGTQSFQSQYPSAHVRKPVFFHEAVARVENELGSCIWLEAGLNSSIISMVRKSCRSTSGHLYQPVGTKMTTRPSDMVADVVAELWKERVFLTHWGCLGVSQSCGDPHNLERTAVRRSRQIWLPPYQFTKKKHWVKWVDRVREVQQSNLPLAIHNEESPQERLPPPLVSCKQPQPLEPQSAFAEFRIHTDNPRYRSVVAGHVVCSRPLCPAPLYMECATMAVLLLLGNQNVLKEKTLAFEKLVVRSPLGLEPQGEVLLRLKQLPGTRTAWSLAVVSVERQSSETTHADGLILYDEDTGILANFNRLVAAQRQRLVDQPQTEILHCDRAYKLFQRVVEYDAFFKGIELVRMNADEAVAAVRLPGGQPHRDEHVAAWRVCDAVAIDAAVHVLGLLINTSETISGQDVAVMVEIQRSIISPGFRTHDAPNWTVYASFSCANDSQQPVGDVFVCSPKGQLVAMFAGCRMTRLPARRLEKMFDKAFHSKSSGVISKELEAKSDPPSRVLVVSPRQETQPSTDGMNTPVSSQRSVHDEKQEVENISFLTDLVAECTGLDPSGIPHDTPLGLMGLDSLGSAELADELGNQFSFSISSLDLLEYSLEKLQQKVVGRQTPATLPPPHQPRVSKEVNSEESREEDESSYSRLMTILAEVSGADFKDIEPTTTLMDLGADSLSMMDLKQEIEDGFSISLELSIDMTVQNLLAELGISEARDQSGGGEAPTRTQSQSPRISTSVSRGIIQGNPFDLLKNLASEFDSAAISHGIADYWTEIAPLQDDITLAYIVQGFAELGVDLRGLTQGDAVPSVPHLKPKYDKLISRLWEILERRNIVRRVSQPGGRGTPAILIRDVGQISGRSASQLLDDFDTFSPSFRNETELIRLTGPRLADCLSGRMDSVALMFGSSKSLKTMADYYGYSPISSTLSAQLSVFLTSILKDRNNGNGPVRILEVGGGTGGTTRWVAAALQEAGIACEYTFTDISPTLAKKAKAKFAPQYPWITFTPFNLETEVRPEFRGKYDIVLATNTVHATTNRISSCRRMSESLKSVGGLVILAELTCHIDWCDICFGLLDGWWLADGPIAPLQTADEWMQTFKQAGFSSMGFSKGRSAGANIAQLLVGCNVPYETPMSSKFIPQAALESQEQVIQEERKGAFRLTPIVYKEVDGVQVHADVYVPKQAPSSPMPIASMIHGGGHVTLSRRAVRPAQTRYLLELGILPVSIDYRLCPEVNLVDGPKQDVCDALKWITGSSSTGDTTDLGWVRPGDPRADLLLTISQQGIALPVLLNGLSEFRSHGKLADLLAPPSTSTIRTISPLARVLQGEYDVPTFIVHGTEDDVAPFAAAKRLVAPGYQFLSGMLSGQ
ncbi:polyketide synthase [Diaporthe helianthi]|uniref:Polyketide synthase n=1 Tax=Diaporthe helianthi TaxID=158607 RepID=A0A2P5HQW5_DIAHE|nr:polyketide synthase [Diaporthe helianthi]